MSTCMAEQCTYVIHVPVAQEDVFRRNGVVKAGRGAHVDGYARARLFRRLMVLRRRRLLELQNNARSDSGLGPRREDIPVGG